jgi:hypothetical protein
LLDAAGCCCCCYRSEQQQLITCQQLQRKFVSSLSLYTLSCLKGSFRNDMHSRQTRHGRRGLLQENNLSTKSRMRQQQLICLNSRL